MSRSQFVVMIVPSEYLVAGDARSEGLVVGQHATNGV